MQNLVSIPTDLLWRPGMPHVAPNFRTIFSPGSDPVAKVFEWKTEASSSAPMPPPDPSHGRPRSFSSGDAFCFSSVGGEDFFDAGNDDLSGTIVCKLAVAELCLLCESNLVW